MQPQPATRGQRFAAAAINLVIGMLPLSIPNIIFAYSQPDAGWARGDVFLDMLTAGLGLLQLLFVHRMQGSPGAVFAGLRVQYLDGTPPKIKTTLTRAMPYLIVVASSVLMPREDGNQALVGILALVLFGVVAFIVTSGITALVTGGHSLMDRVTGTEIVKAYTISRRPNTSGLDS